MIYIIGGWFGQVRQWLRERFPLFGPEFAIPVEQWLLDRLPEDYRLAVWLYLCEGMTFSEVAEALAVSEPGAQGRLREGLKLYQDHLVRLGIMVPARAVVQGLGGNHAGMAPKRLLKSLDDVIRMS